MKVCMLTSTHKPFDVRVFHKESRSLAKFHEVTIIAPDEKKWKKIIDNVRIIAVKKPESKILHLVTLWRVFKEGLKQDCDVYHCHEPDSLIIGLILKILKRNKVKIIYDVHEHWPSEIAYGWLKIKKGFLKKLVENISHILEIFLLKHVDSVIAVSRSVAERFYPVKPVIIIPNVPVKNSIQFQNSDNVERDCDLVQMGGGIQSYHGIREILDALKKVKERHPQVKIKFIGTIKENLNYVLNELKENVVFTGFLPIEKMYEEI
ncbi:MAG: glycosyltransferase, partial [Archaeoglobaceae archaeon]|nr:glycosyltransferase [Archaeoglobaceae archaeon]